MSHGQSMHLLEEPIARELLESQQLAHLAYTWTDGAPRVVPIWFHWNGRAVVMGTPVRAPKVHALQRNPRVALTIDDGREWPYKALLLRGDASVEIVDDVTPEYVASARRYFGDEQGEAWAGSLRGMPMARVTVEPTWVELLDFVTRLPSALAV